MAVMARPSLPAVTGTWAERGVLGGGLLLVVREPEPRRHHDQQRALVEVAELDGEEGGVRLRLGPEHGDGAEIVAARDQRHPDRVAGPLGCGDRAEERLLGGRGRGHAVREEDAAGIEDVAGGVAVGSRDAGAVSTAIARESPTAPRRAFLPKGVHREQDDDDQGGGARGERDQASRRLSGTGGGLVLDVIRLPCRREGL